MTPRRAMDFIRDKGVVLEAARGLEPSLAQRVAGEPIKGSWWSHPKGHEIYQLTRKIHNSRAILICTLAQGRITYVHRRLWPFFVRMEHRFPPHALDRVHEVHLPSGRHQRQDVPFPQWVPESTLVEAKSLSVQEATREIGVWLERYSDARPPFAR
ncbi:MAG: hypothetical protein O7E57_16580 [Gammaproteobacteria bacterium]|nr:hypothetical protein [Gammaproteobacteria bacterium]